MNIVYSTEGYFLGGMEEHKNGCESILKAFRLSMIPIIIQNSLQIIRAPFSTIFFTSLLPDEYLKQLVYRLPLMMLQWQTWMSIIVSIFFTASILYLYVFPAVFILNEMAQ